MSELTLKAIEQLLDKKLDQKLDAKLKPIQSAMAKLATSEELRATERRVMKHAEDMQAELAGMVANQVVSELNDKSHLIQRVVELEGHVKEIRNALHLTS